MNPLARFLQAGRRRFRSEPVFTAGIIMTIFCHIFSFVCGYLLLFLQFILRCNMYHRDNIYVNFFHKKILFERQDQFSDHPAEMRDGLIKWHLGEIRKMGKGDISNIIYGNLCAENPMLSR